jgi:predicted transcriptional regulator
MSNYKLQLFDDNDKLISEESYHKLTDIVKKYNIPYNQLYNILDLKHLNKSRISEKTKKLAKHFKITTSLSGDLNDLVKVKPEEVVFD